MEIYDPTYDLKSKFEEKQLREQLEAEKKKRVDAWRAENPVPAFFGQQGPEDSWKDPATREQETSFEQNITPRNLARIESESDVPQFDPRKIIGVTSGDKVSTPTIVGMMPRVTPEVKKTQGPAATLQAYTNWRDAQRAPERPDTVNRGYTPGEGISSLVGGLGRVMQRRDIGGVAGDEMRARRLAGEESEQQYGRQKSERDAEIERQLGTIRDMRDPSADMASQARDEINMLRARNGLGPIDTEKKLSYEILKNNQGAWLVVPAQKYTGAKKLTAEQQEKLDKAAMAYKGIIDAQSEIAKGGGPRRFEGIKQFFTGKTGFEEARDRYVEAFGRLQSGAAIGSAEDTRFKEMLPTAQDSPTTLERKLVAMSNEMRARIGTLAGNPDDFMQKRFQFDIPVEVAAETEQKREENQTAGSAVKGKPSKTNAQKKTDDSFLKTTGTK